MALEQRFTRQGSRLLYRGAPARLAGIYPRQSDTAGIEALNVDTAPPLDELRARKNNYFRFPMLPYWLYDQPGFAYSPYFRDNNGTWKLDSFNADYFRRLRTMVANAAARGFAVQITLFDATGLEYETADREKRWPRNPWNEKNNYYNFILDEKPPAGGLPEFYHVQHNAKQKELQAKYIQHVVALTKDYWNVFYEIMNEPGGGASDAARRDRIYWADWVTGEIDRETLGGRLIFYNDFSLPASPGGLGGDVNFWRANRAAFQNYDRLDGVIFHGDPNGIDPSSTQYAFRGEKIFLVSTDAAGTVKQDDPAFNKNAARRALDLGMPYQAETLKLTVADVLGTLNLTVLI